MRPLPAALGVLALLLLSAAAVHAQVFVYPRRPSQTNVRYADFDWKYIDVHVAKGAHPALSFPGGSRLHAGTFRPPVDGAAWSWPALSEAPVSRLQQNTAGTGAAAPAVAAPVSARSLQGKPKQGSGGVRLYFYERERPIAERAAASIEDSYQYLQAEFSYTPRVTFAYFLYASYIEFLQTDLFPLQEGVLGVTSPENLDVTLPYFGDARLFADVSTHELAHEFTIQKVARAAERKHIVGDPLDATPLWFVEGLAEYYAKRGIDPETDMLVRDILVNPKTEHDYVLGNFWDDRLTSGLWTYKVGQARCAFLEQAFGKGTLQRILDQSPLLFVEEKHGGVSGFPQLVAKVTGSSAAAIAARFERWIKHRAFETYLHAKHDRGHFTTLHRTRGIVQALRAAPSGELLLYRSIDPDTGQNRLYLFDRRSPGDDETVVADGKPGVETLHPVAGQNFDLTDHELAFVAQVEGSDVIYRQSFVEAALPRACDSDKKKTCSYDVDIDLGKREKFALGHLGIDAVDAITLAPDGKRIGFVGLSSRGQKDLYLITPGSDDAFTLTQLTNDVYAERELSWGPHGLVYSSDATGHGKYNLFQLDPDAPAHVARLTTEARDELNPQALPDGSVLFVAYDDSGANVYSVAQGEVHKETDVSTGLFDVSPGPDGSVWALHHFGADRYPVRIERERFLATPRPSAADAQAPTPPGTLSLARAQPYKALDLHNWSLGSIFLLAGVSGSAVFGQVVASANDRLRDHGLLLSLATWGDTALTDASLFYFNEQKRVVWGAGAFNYVRSRIDRSFEPADNIYFRSWNRFFGGQVLARYPFSRFVFLQAAAAVGGTEYFLLNDLRDTLRDPTANRAGLDLYTPWRAANDGVRFQTEGTLSFGYDTIGMHRATGPIRGSSVLLSSSLGVQPFDHVLYDQTRLDAQHFFPLIGAMNFFVRSGVGSTFGSERAPQYYLSSFQTLRGVPFGDINYLLGREFVYLTGELQFPILQFLSFPLIDLEGVLGADVGAVADRLDWLWKRRLLDLVFGVNFGFGPIVLMLHFGQPVGIGAHSFRAFPGSDPVAPLPNDGHLTFNLSLNWRYQ
ncbi:MAG TPA: hypothetical protein VF331_13690 [Polyangiales bacterium]